ncbi:L,D-transpeptidase [Luteimonas sp. FCS-9]|uniref:L,D-transpeptidase family protein n=1 Tax=Luteimonas sp. FCS-9 TaxID=1547516 RepID=UPI00063E8192|nr:L,D-transpeptidase [Luteimonas sp. FCS-9]KLI99012.1 peptidoglycan-binding protein [Luteimonas sp. FCS-9]
MTPSRNTRARWLCGGLALLLACTPAIAQDRAQPASGQANAGTNAALTAESVNAADAGAGDAAMLRAQVLLDRAHFSPGEIDARGGTNTRRAVLAFQRHRGLEASGEFDARTWDALTGDGAPALVAHTLTADDVAGPFARVPDDMMAQAKRDALGFESVAEALGERFHASPALLRRPNPGRSFRAGARIVVPNVADAGELAKPERVVVSKSDSVVRLVDAAGKVYAQFPASTGTERDPLPIGEWKIEGVAENPTFHYNPDLFWDADPGHAKATLPPGPNNPVGTVWIDLSKPHYGIHGTPEPANIGKTQSHGCIRMTNWSARRVAGVVGPGTVVLLEE